MKSFDHSSMQRAGEPWRPRTRLALALVALVTVTTVAGCSDRVPDQGSPGTAEGVEAAATICPVLWDWVKGIGGAFNDAGRDVADIGDPGERRTRWLSALDEMEQLNEGLAATVGAWSGDSILGPLGAEIERDLPSSTAEIEDLRQLIADTPEVDDQADDQIRAGTLIVHVEKVIELPKPDFVVDDPDGVLLAAFQNEPSCQHTIRGADDGRIQSND